ncbi:RB1-inducible coiled-coil protein 1-like isoform X2 [Dinothrombium tinctorium]|uniref:RB1-inducible coiled-coil protein 1 n=1 Tax=Dinothrombium tinctorium TaxID=1965070 RepID=A0A3S3PL05_9ACAR|nr:RB1-inducible coiled-coil protein 1-like isoform X2 [Dinothrombium tinctorium]RWS17456.1 RB1-inducible coiled-coil protein 1-like isoform X2 [Dinothrombium tinctorium]
MLYVFHVDTGNMMTFDMNLALETVSVLKKAIAKKCAVPEDKQVLLISGGESLNEGSRVCSYSAAGTDTSPIFLFSKNTIESSIAPQPKVDYGADYDMRERVESCLDMEPAINTVVARAELAKQLHEMATQQLNVCEKLVHDQHLQHQGWRAVVANLEDIAIDFEESVVFLNQSYAEFVEKRESYLKLLQNFSHDLELLSNIPLLPKLIGMQLNEGESAENMSLLQWISQKDDQFSLEQVADQCLRSLEQFDTLALDKLKEEVRQSLENVNNKDMKEIKGLEERLYGLEKLMCQAKKLVSEQSDLSQAIYQNQQRASNLRDPSIFPDLCKSHQKQLQLMLQNHQQLRDIRRRCINAKRELSENIHLRLRWIMFVEKKLTDIDAKTFIYRENLRRLKRHLEIIEQVNLAPKVYLSSVSEVVRRKIFSQGFLTWSHSLVKEFSVLHQTEIAARRKFSSEFSTHFLHTLFTGMADLPPPFATEPPKPFDVHLPDLNIDDLKMLQQILPQLAHLIELPSHVPFPNFILEDSTSANIQPKSSWADRTPSETSLEKVSMDREFSECPSPERQIAHLQQQLENQIKLVAQKEEELKAFKATFQAEKQIIFNETLSQITKEKDECIRNLQTKESRLSSAIDSIYIKVAQLKKSIKRPEDVEILASIENIISSINKQDEPMIDSFVELPQYASEKEKISELQNVKAL